MHVPSSVSILLYYMYLNYMYISIYETKLHKHTIICSRIPSTHTHVYVHVHVYIVLPHLCVQQLQLH